MKNFAALAVLSLLSLSPMTSAIAALPVSPAKGDVVVYRTLTGREATLTSTVRQEITNENADRTVFEIRTTTTAAGQSPQESTESVGVDELVNAEVIQSILTNCAELDGTRVQLRVNGRTMETCKLHFAEEGYVRTTWYAAVPFGVAKLYSESPASESAPASIQTVELSTFTYGRP